MDAESAQWQLSALATNAALLRRSGSDVNADVNAAAPATPPHSDHPTMGTAGGAALGTSTATAAPTATTSSKALIHALECLQNKIRTMESQKASLHAEFEQQRTRTAGELAELRLLCSRQELELVALRSHSDDRSERARASEQAAVDAWEKTGVLNAALARANAQVEHVSQQLQQRDEELTAMHEQLSRASSAVSVAGDRAADYSTRVTETVSELSQARAELHAVRLEAEAANERAVAAERMVHELRRAADAAAEKEKNEHTRAEYANASLRSVLNLSSHAAAELPRELQQNYMADPLSDLAHLSEPTQASERQPEVADSWLGAPSSLPDDSAAAAAAAAAVAAAKAMGPRIPGLPGYYLDVQAKLDPKYKTVREKAERQASGSGSHVWVPAGPALSDGRQAPSSPNSRHASTAKVDAPVLRSTRRRGGGSSRRPTSAPARRNQSSAVPSTPRGKAKMKSGGKKPTRPNKAKSAKSAKPAKQAKRKSVALPTEAMMVAATAGRAEHGRDSHIHACEEAIRGVRAEIDSLNRSAVAAHGSNSAMHLIASLQAKMVQLEAAEADLRTLKPAC
jgi:hypothetical protein